MGTIVTAASSQTKHKYREAKRSEMTAEMKKLIDDKPHTWKVNAVILSGQDGQEHLKYYYYNMKTNRSQWHHPVYPKYKNNYRASFNLPSGQEAVGIIQNNTRDPTTGKIMYQIQANNINGKAYVRIFVEEKDITKTQEVPEHSAQTQNQRPTCMKVTPTGKKIWDSVWWTDSKNKPVSGT